MPETLNFTGRTRVTGHLLLVPLGGNEWLGQVLPSRPRPEEMPAGAQAYALDTTLTRLIDAGVQLTNLTLEKLGGADNA